MEIRIANTFWKGFKKMINSENPWRWQFWVHRFYDFKWTIKNFFKYFKIVSKMRPWDFRYNLEMMKFQLEILCNNIKYGNEIDETRLPKIEKMRRFIELADNQLEDNFADRCGYISRDIEFVKDENGIYTINFNNETEEESEQNSKALKESHELEKKEWDEMMDILKDARSWWD